MSDISKNAESRESDSRRAYSEQLSCRHLHVGSCPRFGCRYDSALIDQHRAAVAEVVTQIAMVADAGSQIVDQLGFHQFALLIRVGAGILHLLTSSTVFALLYALGVSLLNLLLLIGSSALRAGQTLVALVRSGAHTIWRTSRPTVVVVQRGIRRAARSSYRMAARLLHRT